MKTCFSALLFVSLFVFSCSTPSSNPATKNSATDEYLSYQKNHGENSWMDPEDFVRYVNFFSRSPSSSVSKYKITGTCGGFPRVDVKTPAGFCLGLVSDGQLLKKPRTAAVISATEVLVADQGSWNPYDGKILVLRMGAGTSEVKELFSAKTFAEKDPKREIINRPHQILKGNDGKFYVGSFSSLLRFDPNASSPKDSIEILINNLPAQGLHPLKAFAFDPQGNIYINVGSATNVCQKSGVSGKKLKTCAEAENFEVGQAQIRKYSFLSNGKINPKFEVYAKGLRNSVAILWDEKRNVLLQGENSRDAIHKLDASLSNAELPHDELNVVEKGKHYGWPYCFDNNRNSPEWTYVDCRGYQKPYALLPPHSAPLAMHYYQGKLFPAWYQGRLLVSLHGYEPKGHRIVAFKRNDQGLPVGVPQSVVWGWDTKGEQKFGSPVGLTEMPDGSLLIIEDNNKKILRLHYNAEEGDGKPVEEIYEASDSVDLEDPKEEQKRKEKLDAILQLPNPPPFAMYQARVIDKTCYTCHGGENAPGVQLLRHDFEGNAKRILAAEKVREILEMMRGNPEYPPMPPQGFDSEEERANAERWLRQWANSLQ